MMNGAAMEVSISAAAAAAAEDRLLLGAEPTFGPDEPGAGAEEARARVMRTRAATAASAPRCSSRRTCGWLPLPFFPRNKDAEPFLIKVRDTKHLMKLREERRRATQPGHFKRLAKDRGFVTECLQYYNYMHPNAEYEPAPGKVIKFVTWRNGTRWTHGNFVARRKRSGCFSFLPAPRTLFFFELMHSPDFTGVVTCTPLDEPVTEGYSILGFPIWWGTRRNGNSDVFCKTCYRHFEFPHRLTSGTLACGHENAEGLCQMCDCRSCVLHPFPDQENVHMPIADTFIATSAEHGPAWIECIPDF
ncbi:unnamed protein product [Urochloa decumbens]|uniref:DUF3615 domain-containing protein n=1 Tax=Urochloa decumbens TaxID=240449 RepID=A0ABC9FX11_9POAL